MHAEHTSSSLPRAALKAAFQVVDGGYGLWRYLRYSNSLRRSVSDRRKMESLLFFYYHRIEKGLSMPAVKPVFGVGYLGTLLDLLVRWVDTTNDLDAVAFNGACDALVAYRDHVGSALATAHPELLRRLDEFLATHRPGPSAAPRGGREELRREELQDAFRDGDFERVVRCRRSVRTFTSEPVPDAVIEHAVRLAQHSPSVCNRQCVRVHVFTTAADKATVLEHQNGNLGFGHLADRILMVTADLSAFVISGERNQGYSDAGMFSMTLLYALQAHGIASCCLNLCNSFRGDMALRRACRIPSHENPVMMIAVGYPPSRFPVAMSARRPLSTILAFRRLGKTSEDVS